MDPISIIGLIASVGSVADIVAKSISKLGQLRTKYRDAPFIIAVLLGQLCTITTALDQLKEWSKNYLGQNPRFEKLASQLQEALVNFQPVLSLLDKELKTHDQEEMNNIRPKDRLCFVWKEQDLRNYLQILDCQVNTLTLLLQAVQCKSWTVQTTLMSTDGSQSIIKYAQDCSSSIMALNDGISIYPASSVVESSDTVSRKFDFDRELLCSSVYGTAYRSHFKRIVKTSEPKTQPPYPTDVEAISATIARITSGSEVVALNSPAAAHFFHNIIIPELRHYSFGSSYWLMKSGHHGRKQLDYDITFGKEISRHAFDNLIHWFAIEKTFIFTRQSSLIRNWTRDVNIHLILSKHPIEYALGFIAECSLIAVNRDTKSPQIAVLSAASDVVNWCMCLEVSTEDVFGGPDALRKEYLRVGILANSRNTWRREFYISRGSPMDFS